MAHRVLCVLGGRTPPFQDLAALARGATRIWAADSGQEVCMANGFTPHVVVGDLDSVARRLPEVDYRERPDQDCSDCDKLLAEVAQLGPVNLVFAGLEGDRFDHVLASLSSIARSGLFPRVVLQQGYGVFAQGGRALEFNVVKGQVFSLLSFGMARVTTKGARWNLEDRLVSFQDGFSLSNECLGERLEILVHEGLALAILDSQALEWD